MGQQCALDELEGGQVEVVIGDSLVFLSQGGGPLLLSGEHEIDRRLAGLEFLEPGFDLQRGPLASLTAALNGFVVGDHKTIGDHEVVLSLAFLIAEDHVGLGQAQIEARIDACWARKPSGTAALMPML